MKHGFLKVVIMLIVISLFMALTGCGNRQRVVLAVVNPQFLLKGKADQILLTVDTEVKGSGRAELYLNTLNALQESRLKGKDGVATAFRDDYTVINVNEKKGRCHCRLFQQKSDRKRCGRAAFDFPDRGDSDAVI